MTRTILGLLQDVHSTYFIVVVVLHQFGITESESRNHSVAVFNLVLPVYLKPEQILLGCKCARVLERSGKDGGTRNLCYYPFVW